MMNAAEFFSAFEQGVLRHVLPEGIRRMAGRTPKWKVPLPDGSVVFPFGSNFKVAGLHSEWPGEFRLLVSWHRGRGAATTREEVSFFQYASAAEIQHFRELQQRAVTKFLAARADVEREAFWDLLDPEAEPVPNHDRWYYYFDQEDAGRWGSFFGSAMSGWMERFRSAPESRDAWCQRVLWSLTPDTGSGAPDAV